MLKTSCDSKPARVPSTFYLGTFFTSTHQYHTVMK